VKAHTHTHTHTEPNIEAVERPASWAECWYVSKPDIGEARPAIRHSSRAACLLDTVLLVGRVSQRHNQASSTSSS